MENLFNAIKEVFFIMFEGFTRSEIELLSAYDILNNSAKRDMRDYVKYLLCKQYKKESTIQVFNNQVIHNLFHHILHLMEKEKFDPQHLEKRIKQIKEIYFYTFEQVHLKYSKVIIDLDSNELVLDFGRNSFENIERAFIIGNTKTIKMEILEFYEQYLNISKKKDSQKVIAV